ncbi:MAG: 50S ribosomal protein L15e [Candidatus Aenigmatarchaeota archaeon]|nr:MAG: 50S ribosomal protein L15e [Candidatus Aenigmarchaeota archaeon]
MSVIVIDMETANDTSKQNVMRWRRQGTIERVEKPTNLSRARKLGYKAKQGFVVLRVRVPKGKRKRPKPAGGRNPRKAGRFFTLDKSKQQVAEEKASRKHPNMEVMNSYIAGEDGSYKWFECIVVDRSHPAVRKDKERKWIAAKGQRGRAFRGLTSSGKKSRGLRA